MNAITNICIRVADEIDVGVIIDLGVTTFNDTFAHLNSAEDMEAYLSSTYTPDLIAAEIRDPLVTYLIAEYDNRPIAYSKLYRGQPESCITGARAIEIARFYVAKNMHGCGIAHLLMVENLKQAAAERYDTIWLGVWEHNERAKAFYRKQGFREVGSHIFQLGSDPQTDVLMERAV
jgi:ribosomal protein S18 acetylase RimI-like enzyme